MKQIQSKEIRTSLELSPNDTYISLTKEIFWGTDIDEEDCFRDFRLSILIDEPSYDSPTEIGYISGTCIVLSGISDVSAPEVAMAFDCESADLFDLANALRSKRNNQLKEALNESSILIFIDELFIEKEYRHQGVGSATLKNLEIIFRKKCVMYIDAIALNPYPQEKYGNRLEDYQGEDLDEKIKALQKFYRRLGYKKVFGSRVYANVLYTCE